MSLLKYSKNDLIRLGNEGYEFIKCEDEEEALQVKQTLKEDKRCAQAGFVINRENETIYFVATKERRKKK